MRRAKVGLRDGGGIQWEEEGFWSHRAAVRSAAAFFSPSAGGRRPAALQEEAGGLAEALGEFEAVLEDFACPAGRSRFHYGEHLERMKRRSSASVSDGSGLSDSESECGSVGLSVCLCLRADRAENFLRVALDFAFVQVKMRWMIT